MEKTYYVYILCSNSGVLYVGMTNNIFRRVYEHKQGVHAGFTKKYKVHRLVYFEETNDVWTALRREKQIKKWRRSKKKALIQRFNPQ